jgi:TRAP-type C4-dicarboxylate transport system permease small subunit
MATLALAVDRLSAWLDRIALGGAVLAVLVMVASAIWQVVARYIFFAPPVWTEELARYAMVWAGMLGASSAFRAMADPTLFPAMREMGGRLGGFLAGLRATGVLLFAIPVLYYCLQGPRGGFSRGFLARSSVRDAEMIDVSMIWFTIAVPVAFTLILIHLMADLAMRASGQGSERSVS